MCTVTEKNVRYHKWADELNLGRAPFHVVAVISFPSKALAEANTNAYNAACRENEARKRAYGIDLLGICNVCGMNLTNNYIVRDADRKHFVVGSSCAEKCGDSVVMTEAAKHRKLHERKLRKARAERKREAKRLEYLAKCDAERDANEAKGLGRLTDYEVAEAARLAEREAEAEKHAEANADLIEALEAGNGGFCSDMARELSRASALSLSPRARYIIAEIAAKHETGKTMAAKATKEAFERFRERLEV